MSTTPSPETMLLVYAVMFGVSLLFYVWIALALSKVFAKQGIAGWKAWVPFLNGIEFFRLGGQWPYWVFISLVPGVGVVATVFFIIAIHGVTKRFGKGAGFTVLGVFLFAIWATILGFGRAQAVDPNAPPVYQPITKVPYGAPPVAQPPKPAAPIGAPPVASAPVAPPAAPVPPLISAPPVASPPPPSVPVRAPVQPVVLDTGLDEDDAHTRVAGRVQRGDDASEHTVVVNRRSKQWTLTTDDGQSVRLTGSVVLLGRNPTRDPAHPDAQLVPLDDTAKTVSKTHARIELVGTAWQIVDLDSTNGVVLVEKDDETEVQPGVTVELTERFLLGELPVRIHQEHGQ